MRRWRILIDSDICLTRLFQEDGAQPKAPTDLCAKGLAGLRVIARTSSFAFRGKDQDIRRIAEALDVRTILEGSVRRAGDRIRITAQLINAADGSHLWSDRFDREMTDVFAVQDEISQSIVETLKVKLTARSAATSRQKANVEAYVLSLQ